MISSNLLKKCKGCGTRLSLDKNELGYVPKLNKDTKYCYRCFQLKNYNKNITNQHINQVIKKNLDEINLNNKNVFWIIDVLDLYGSKIKIQNNYEHLYLIINKMDLFNRQRNIEKIQTKIIENINYLNFNYDKIIFCSAKANNSLKKINDFMKRLNKNSKNIFIGKTNVGKSSIINGLLSINNLNPNLTVNNALNTTINLQKIKCGYQFIIDTPGVNDNTSLLAWINENDLSKISFNKNNSATKNFQIKYSKRIVIENLIIIDIVPNENICGSITFYLNKNLNIMSKKISNDIKFNQTHKLNYKDHHQQTIKTHNFDFKEIKNNITISGLGLISLKNIKTIKIHLLSPIGVYQWKYPII